MTRENKLALVLGFGLMLFVGILVSDHVAARKAVPPAVALNDRETGVPPIPAPGDSGQIIRQGDDGTRALAGDGPSDEADRAAPSGGVIAPAPPESARAARTSGPELPEPVSHRTYQVKKGDSPEAIAKQVYGRNGLGEKLAAFNGLKPSALKIGATLKLPPLTELDPSAAIAAGSNMEPVGGSEPREGEVAAADQFRNYTVREGDTLYRIAARELGSANRWKELLSSNDFKESQVLKPGMQIKIPARTTDG
jgi:nucleoid-associated protein YgaU